MSKEISINSIKKSELPKIVKIGGIYLMACGTKVTKALTYDCTYAPAGGNEVVAYIGNREDIDTITYDGTNISMVTGITMLSGKKMYKYTGYKNAWDPEMALNKAKFGNNYIHSVGGNLGINTPSDKEELQNLFQGNVFMIVENKLKGLTGNQAFEVYGITVGMEADTATRKQSDAETQGSYKFQLKSADGQFEPRLPNTFWVSPGLTATRAALAALIV